MTVKQLEEQNINDKFRELVGLGYSAKEALLMLGEDLDVDQEVLERMTREF